MAKRMFSLAIMLLVSGQATVALAQIAGHWDVKTVQGDLPSFHEMVVDQKEDGSLVATWNGLPLEQFKFESPKLSFIRRQDIAGYEVLGRFSGTLADGKISGVLSSEMGQVKVKACPAQPLPVGVGLWDIDMDAMGNVFKVRLAVSVLEDGSLAGQWDSEIGEHEISAVKCQEDKMTFKRSSVIEGTTMSSTFEGTIKDSTLSGQMRTDWGDWSIKGQRMHADFVGRWTVETDSMFGPALRRLDILPDLSVRYQVFDGGLNPLKNVKIQGNQLTAMLALNLGGQIIELPFKATLTDGVLKGTLSSDQGDIHFTSKKKV